PTAVYRYLPQMDVEDAAQWIVDAVAERPARRTTPSALVFYIATAIAPGPALKWLGDFYRRRGERLMKKLKADQARQAASSS
ncbi:hypothetical protein ABTK13_22750, partial [Acinetobacter baumannii]